MSDMEIRLDAEADSFLQDLPYVLLNEGYKSSLEAALDYVDDILEQVRQLPFMPHYQLSPMPKRHYAIYGEDLRYAFFKRKSAPQTTWYIFFQVKENRYLVKHIANNWLEGQFIR